MATLPPMNPRPGAPPTTLRGIEPPRLLVLRVWNEPERFRALVRELEPERTRDFRDPMALLAFLLQTAETSDTPRRPPPCTP